MLVLWLLFGSFTIAAEGDYYEYRGKCEIELADGSRQAAECPKSIPAELSQAQIAENIELLVDAEARPEFHQAKQFSAVRAKLSESDLRGGDFPVELMKYSKRFDAGKIPVRISFRNDQSYPRKYSSGRGYYAFVNGKVRTRDSAFAKRWDTRILNQFVGKDHEQYQATVKAISDTAIILHVRLETSDQLKRILEGKSGIMNIDHPGLPEPEFEEVIR